MESLSKMHHSHLSLAHHNSSFPTVFSPRFFRSLPLPPFSPPSFKSFSIRASSTPLPKAHLRQTLNPHFSPLVKSTCIAIAATAFFFTRLQLNTATAAPVLPPSDSSVSETLPSAVEEQQPSNNLDEADALRSLTEEKIRAGEIDEAIRVLERLISLEPEELEWLLLKAHLYIHNGEHKLALNVFESVLKKEPFNVEAYRGFLMANSELNEPSEELLKRIEEAVRVCEEEEMDSEVRDFKLLIAQIKVIDGELSDALKVYEELVKEEPKDFRPYLCQGIVYTMLRKQDEAEKQFEKYRTLVPQDHPYKEYFEDNTKIFSQSLESGGIGAKS
ncbi:protein SLOW GREEN 1, chloroplastic-like [Abrus precatorius]|uniref:Protein SLOW GREEN 1, chloroplastic-like n=1 Tax=Abrus precatorius TaxID=3816 RepID=A0A8B8M4V6_ABRPR|nr:protein SLOW GREEN 1, chloroplastic-like [Abrus precatorius]